MYFEEGRSILLKHHYPHTLLIDTVYTIDGTTGSYEHLRIKTISFLFEKNMD